MDKSNSYNINNHSETQKLLQLKIQPMNIFMVENLYWETSTFSLNFLLLHTVVFIEGAFQILVIRRSIGSKEMPAHLNDFVVVDIPQPSYLHAQLSQNLQAVRIINPHIFLIYNYFNCILLMKIFSITLIVLSLMIAGSYSQSSSYTPVGYDTPYAPFGIFIEESIVYICQYGCRRCEDRTTCLQCLPNFYLEQQSCFLLDGITCAQAAYKEYCSECFINEIILPDGYTCSPCSDSCSSCTTGGCSACHSGFLNTQLQNQSQYICEACQLKNCQTCKIAKQQKQCQKCSQGHYLSFEAPICFPCLNGCAECASFNVTFCVDCLSSYYLKNQNCYPCSDNCIRCTDPYSCSACKPLYTLDQGLCVQGCKYPCFQCQSGQPQKCTTCYGGFDLTNDMKCVANNQCSNSKTCTFCSGMFYPQHSQCFPSNAMNCLLPYDQKLCATCLQSYYNSEGICYKCPTGCISCYGPTACFDCADGYIIDIHSNEKNNPDYLYGICVPCKQPCASCINQKSSCLSCKSGYILRGMRCIDPANSIMFSISFSVYSSFFPSGYQQFYKIISKTLENSIDQIYNDYITYNPVVNIKGYISIKSGTRQQAIDKINNLQNEQVGFTINQKNLTTNVMFPQIQVTPPPQQLYEPYKTPYVPFGVFLQNQQIFVCEHGCRKCLSSTRCAECLPNFYLQSQDCYLLQGITCARSQSQGKCSSCFSSQLDLQSQQTTCRACDVNCVKCTQGTSLCLYCRSGYGSQQNICSKCTLENCDQCLFQGDTQYCQNCKYGFYLNSQTSRCLPCLNECAQCKFDNFTKCNKCLDSYFLINNQCQPCPQNCLKCTDNSSCQVCQPFYNFEQGVCIHDCNYPCLQCKFRQPQRCTACYGGFDLTADDRCVVNSLCSDSRSCITCNPGFYLSNGQCLSSTASNCLLPYNQTKCSNCQIGYYNQEGTCMRCPLACLSCYGPLACYDCQRGFIHDVSRGLFQNQQVKFGLCLACQSPCETCIKFRTSCLSCISGYRLRGFKCIKEDQSIMFLISFSGSNEDLISSIDDFDLAITKYALNGKIKQLYYDHVTYQPTLVRGYIQIIGSRSQAINSLQSYFQGSQTFGQVTLIERKITTDLVFPTEKSINQDAEKHTAYITAYAPFGTQRIYNSMAFICEPGCRICTGTSCRECLPNFYLQNQNCYLLRGKTCALSQSQGVCSQCFVTQQTLSQISTSCQLCDENCAACHKTPNSCFDCHSGEFLIFQTSRLQCKQCSLQNCIECINNNDQISCQYCSQGYYLNYGTLQCLPCLNQCTQCQPTNFAICYKCLDTYYLENNHCYSCPANCLRCNNAQSCQSCKPFYHIENQLCQPDCKYPCFQCRNGEPSTCTNCYEGFSLRGNQCTPNNPCSTNGNCSVCHGSFYLSNGQCLATSVENCLIPYGKGVCSNCNIGFYNKEGVCFKCPDQCLSCYGPKACAYCADGYIHDIHRSDKKSLKYRYGVCVPCQPPCATCISYKTSCLTCLTGYTLRGLQCINLSKSIMFKLGFEGGYFELGISIHKIDHKITQQTLGNSISQLYYDQVTLSPNFLTGYVEINDGTLENAAQKLETLFNNQKKFGFLNVTDVQITKDVPIPEQPKTQEKDNNNNGNNAQNNNQNNNQNKNEDNNKDDSVSTGGDDGPSQQMVLGLAIGLSLGVVTIGLIVWAVYYFKNKKPDVQLASESADSKYKIEAIQ